MTSNCTENKHEDRCYKVNPDGVWCGYEYNKQKEEQKEKINNDRCKCGHIRGSHGKSHSINYTEGVCKKCHCKNFVIKMA